MASVRAGGWVVLMLSTACKPSEPVPSERAPAEREPTLPASTEPAEPTVVEPTPSEPTPSEPVPSEPPAIAAPIPAALFADVTLTGDPAEVTANLAKSWCAHGGDSFRAPATGPVAANDSYPPRLGSCADVTVEQQRRDEAEGITATLFTIDAIWEARELLLLQTKQHAALVELERRREDESGEAGPEWREHLEVELRDVTGTPTPEWIAKTRDWGGDNYEADRCYATTYELRQLIVCSEGEAGFACFAVPYRRTDASAPRPADELEDCGPAAKLDPPRMTGWALRVEVERERAVFRVDESVELDADEDAGMGSAPTHVGEVSLATLFADEPLAVGVFEQDSD